MRKFKTLAKQASHPDLIKYALESICKKKSFKSPLPSNFTQCEIISTFHKYTEDELIKRILNHEWAYKPEIFDYMEAIYQHTLALIALNLDSTHTSVSGDIILECVRNYFKESIKAYDDVAILEPCFKDYMIKYIEREVSETAAYHNLDQELEVIQQPKNIHTQLSNTQFPETLPEKKYG